LVIILYFLLNNINGLTLNKKNLVVCFLVVHILYFLFKLLVFHNVKGFFVGTTINLLLLILGNCLIKFNI